MLNRWNREDYLAFALLGCALALYVVGEAIQELYTRTDLLRDMYLRGLDDGNGVDAEINDSRASGGIDGE